MADDKERRGPVKSPGPNSMPKRTDKTNPDRPTGSGYQPPKEEAPEVPDVQTRVARADKNENGVAWTETRGATRATHSPPTGPQPVDREHARVKQPEGEWQSGGRRTAEPADEQGVGAGDEKSGEKVRTGSGLPPDEQK